MFFFISLSKDKMHHAYAKHWFNCFDISTFSASSVPILLTNSCTVSPDTTLSCKRYFQKVTAIDLSIYRIHSTLKTKFVKQQVPRIMHLKWILETHTFPCVYWHLSDAQYTYSLNKEIMYQLLHLDTLGNALMAPVLDDHTCWAAVYGDHYAGFPLFRNDKIPWYFHDFSRFLGKISRYFFHYF